MTTETRRRSRGRARTDAPEMAAAPRADSEAQPRLEVRRLEEVVAAVLRMQTRALILGHLAEESLARFGVGDAGPPKLLVRLPGGGPFAAAPEHVISVANELRRLASKERGRVERLLASYSTATAEDVDPPSVLDDGPNVAAKPGEAVIDASPNTRGPRS